ncbi:FdtA/QdtA family cupin domain-containing protein [Echinicola jeungdonensis]|uniref:FdtA/QdtA family cupin domain-containing protein n=1 Tax=Echinicola jeungdonensis TaxID=709343 RepID=A0ABV5J4G8_9BACT|nr:FdtA/QdtA family cupin domain-containing protein [Echinicola jeungdonensis]MDN3667928.1 FdtA/QdtA family cupin domain-containing protein [Echinicola jeungdonensis]
MIQNSTNNLKMTKPYVFQVGKTENPQGMLHYLEQQQIPFQIKRTFWISGVPENSVRGVHAHHKDQQVTICLQGKVEVKLEDLAKKQYLFTLESPEQVLFLPHLVWSEFVFYSNAILLVMANENFSEDDYIRDKKVFEKLQDEYRKKL